MLKKLVHLWNTVFAPRRWTMLGDAATGTWVMRRWAGDTWETRPATREESEDAMWWQAVR